MTAPLAAPVSRSPAGSAGLKFGWMACETTRERPARGRGLLGRRDREARRGSERERSRRHEERRVQVKPGRMARASALWGRAAGWRGVGCMDEGLRRITAIVGRGEGDGKRKTG